VCHVANVFLPGCSLLQMNLRTMVASKNARGKKASMVLSQSLEIAPSDPGALTRQMVDTAASTFHPLSPAGTMRVAHGSGSVTGSLATGVGHMGVPSLEPLQFTSPPSSQHSLLRPLGGGLLSERSSQSVETGTSLGTGRVGSPSPPITAHPRNAVSRENTTSGGLQRGVSREDSFFLNASDFLAAAPINYELSSHRLTAAETLKEMARSLGGDDNSVGSGLTHGSKFTKKKAVKVNRVPQQSTVGQYQYVHSDDKIPEWGTVHGQAGGGRVDSHVVLGISGVNSIGGHTAKVYGTKGEFGANSGHVAPGASSTLSAAGSALLRTSINAGTMSGSKPANKGLEIDVGLPEVKIQSYNVPTQRQNPFGASAAAGGVGTRQPAYGGSFDTPYLHSGPNSRGSHASNLGGLGATSAAGEALQLMLDSPSLGGSSAYPGFDFDRDRHNPARLAGELPASQEMVHGIVVNHRTSGNAAYTTTNEGAGMLHSASQGSVSAYSQPGRSNKTAASHKYGAGQQPQAQQGAAGITGVSEDILKRLRKELLSR
jgi:hypothetical protein